MKSIMTATTLALAMTVFTAPVMAKGCIKGAVVGGVAGHFAGHHTKTGAAAGCVIGHHKAAKHARQNSRDTK
jgi:outer membrane lipoprotein SlyB